VRTIQRTEEINNRVINPIVTKRLTYFQKKSKSAEKMTDCIIKEILPGAISHDSDVKYKTLSEKTQCRILKFTVSGFR